MIRGVILLEKGIEGRCIGVDNDFGNMGDSKTSCIHFEMGIDFFVFTDDSGFCVVPHEFLEQGSHYSMINDINIKMLFSLPSLFFSQLIKPL